MNPEEIVLCEPLLSELVSEEKLNNLIANSVDINTLNAALNLKLFFLKTKKQSALSFSIENIVRMDFKKHENHFLQAMKSGLLLQQSSEEYKRFLKFLDAHIHYFGNEDFMILKLIQVALEVAIIMNLKDLFFENKTILDIIIKAVDCRDKIIFEFLCFKLLPLYLSTCSVQCKNSTLQKIFEVENIDAMCALSDFFLPNNLDCVFTLISHERFWYIIQSCINSDSKQKQGLFLLKKAITIIFNDWHTALSILPSVAKLHTQDKSEAENMWTNYITLLEVVREDHFYLIEPLFPLLLSLHIFDHTWVICIYNILLSHSNYLVVHTAFNYYLKHSISDVQTFEGIVKLIAPHLNKCPNLKLLKNTYSNLKTYLIEANESFTIMLLKEGTSINWSPLTLWYYYKCMLFQQNVLLPYDIIKNYFVLTLSLPHKYIRRGCLSILLNYVVDILQHKTYSFKDRLKIFNLFYKQNEITSYKLDKIIEKSESLEFISQISKSCMFSVHDNIQDIENGIKLAIYYKINLSSLKMYFQSVDNIKSIDVRLLDSMFIKCFNYYEKDVEFLYNYIIYRLKNLHHDGTNDDYVALIHAFVSHTLNNDFCLKLERKAIELLLDENGIYLDEQKQAAFNIVIAFKNTTDIESVCDKWTKKFLSGEKEVSHKTCSYFLSLYVLCTFHSNNITDEILNEASDIFFRVIETQHHEMLPDLFKKLLPQLLINVNNTNVLKDILMKCSQTLTQTSKCSAFKDVLNSFVESVFINDALLLDDTLFESFSKIFYILYDLAKTHAFIALKIVHVFKSVFDKKKTCYSKFSHVITNFILMQKNVCTLSERSEYEVCQEVYQYLHLKDNPNLCHQQIHFGVLEVLQIIIRNENKAERNQLVDDLTRNLLEKYFSNFYKKRYFPNSEIHFFKQRIMQVLLFLQPHTSVEIRKDIIKLIIDSLCYENHQPSVRQLMQWLLIRLIAASDGENGIKVLTDLFDADVNLKNKLFIVLSPVIYHVARNASENILLTIFETFLPIAMGAQFKSRLYAQLILHELYATAIKKRYLEITKSYRFLDASLKSIFSPCKDKISEILQSDKEFLFDFDPFKHYSLETIYVDIPKLNNVISTNWENFHVLKITEYPIINVLNSCRTLSSKTNTQKSEDYEDIFAVNTNNCTSNIENIQKKINTFDIFEENCTKTVANDFILIGSLIEKTTNLGGLSRSCEVFGINCFVINNIKILEAPEFKSLSMTSQKWINVLEVKNDELKNFLLKQKEKGFEIVAAEQTTSSILLGKYAFKKKTVLLLGNEKEGIPADLLLLADVCIEIPQQGVIRSLNVHVAGALLMWEYHKQHHCNNI